MPSGIELNHVRGFVGNVTCYGGVGPCVRAQNSPNLTIQGVQSNQPPPVTVNGQGAVGNMYGGTVNNNFGPAPPRPTGQILSETKMPTGEVEMIVAVHIDSTAPIGTVKIDGNEHVNSIAFEPLGGGNFSGYISSGRHFEIQNQRDFGVRLIVDGIGKPNLQFSFE